MTTIPAHYASPLSDETLALRMDMDDATADLIHRFGWLRAQRMMQDVRTRFRDGEGKVPILTLVQIVTAEHEGEEVETTADDETTV